MYDAVRNSFFRHITIVTTNGFTHPFLAILGYMKGYTQNIEALSLENENFRKVLYTSKYGQLVVMSLKPGEDIGEEVHDVDQFLRIEKGVGKAIIDGVEHDLTDGFAVVVPAGAKHNIVNGDGDVMKLYSLYMPPHHQNGVVHATKEDAMGDEEHFDGTTTE